MRKYSVLSLLILAFAAGAAIFAYGPMGGGGAAIYLVCMSPCAALAVYTFWHDIEITEVLAALAAALAWLMVHDVATGIPKAAMMLVAIAVLCLLASWAARLHGAEESLGVIFLRLFPVLSVLALPFVWNQPTFASEEPAEI